MIFSFYVQYILDREQRLAISKPKYIRCITNLFTEIKVLFIYFFFTQEFNNIDLVNVVNENLNLRLWADFPLGKWHKIKRLVEIC